MARYQLCVIITIIISMLFRDFQWKRKESIEDIKEIIRSLFPGGLQEFHKNYSHLCSKPLQPLSPPMLYSPTTPIVDCSIDNATISQILPFLFIGK